MGRNRNEKLLKKVGKRIKQIRIEKGLSTRYLSDVSDISRSQIIAIEKGEINATISTLFAISNGLGVEMKDLFV